MNFTFLLTASRISFPGWRRYLVTAAALILIAYFAGYVVAVLEALSQ